MSNCKPGIKTKSMLYQISEMKACRRFTGTNTNLVPGNDRWGIEPGIHLINHVVCLFSPEKWIILFTNSYITFI